MDFCSARLGPASRSFRVLSGLLAVLVGAFGLSWSLRAAVAQRSFLRAKHGLFRNTRFEVPPVEDGAEAVRLCRAAMRLYPWNWYFPSWAAKVAYLEATDPATPDERWPVALEDSVSLAAQALALNPYDAEIRWVYAETLVAKGRLREAIEWWRSEVVEREFWNPENQRELASLLLREKSEESVSEALTLIPLVPRQMQDRLRAIQRERAKRR